MAAAARREGVAWLATAGLAALLASGIVAIHRDSPRTLVSAHGMLHAAVAQELAAHPTPLPPENPFFAGEPLPYYWVFHALGAVVSRALGVDPLRGFEALIVLAAVVLCFTATALARSLHGRAALGPLMAFLVLAGGHPQALAYFGWRLARWGPEMLAEDPSYLWGLAHPLIGRVRLGDPYALYGPPLNFFLNVTSRPLALAALLVAVLALERLWRRRGVGRAACAVAAMSACTALSPIVGLPTAVALAGGIAAVALAGRVWPRLGPTPAAGFVALAAAVLVGGAALGLSTALHLLGRGAGGATLLGGGAAGMAGRLGTEIACAWLTAALALVALGRAPASRRPRLVALALAATVLCAAAVAVTLPVANEVNFFHAGALLLAVLAPGALVDPRGRVAWWGVGALVVVFLPTALFTVWSYTGRPPVPVAFGARLERGPADGAEARLYSWIRGGTPDRAVFVISPDDPIRAVLGNTAELPAFTGRALWTDRPRHYLVEAHPDAERRGRIARSLLAGRPLAADDASYLASLGREVFVLVDPPLGRAVRDAVALRLGAPVFRAGEYAVFRWRPPGEAAAP